MINPTTVNHHTQNDDDKSYAVWIGLDFIIVFYVAVVSVLKHPVCWLFVGVVVLCSFSVSVVSLGRARSGRFCLLVAEVDDFNRKS